MRVREFLWAALLAFLVGIVSLLLDPQNVLRALIAGAATAAALLLITWSPVSAWLPSLSLERSDGLALRLRGPMRRLSSVASKTKLRKEALGLASDIYAYCKAHPSAARSLSEHHTVGRLIQQEPDEARQSEIWNEYTTRMTEQSEAEKRDLQQHFGGRLQYVAEEFDHRGMLTQGEVHRLLLQAQNLAWIALAASRIEALARRL
jgi:hypothetical protein